MIHGQPSSYLKKMIGPKVVLPCKTTKWMKYGKL
jgi:hypothetical protein